MHVFQCGRCNWTGASNMPMAVLRCVRSRSLCQCQCGRGRAEFGFCSALCTSNVKPATIHYTTIGSLVVISPYVVILLSPPAQCYGHMVMNHPGRTCYLATGPDGGPMSAGGSTGAGGTRLGGGAPASGAELRRRGGAFLVMVRRTATASRRTGAAGVTSAVRGDDRTGEEVGLVMVGGEEKGGRGWVSPPLSKREAT